jgi:3-hydroxybutyryl-CoA dehydrogenase
MRQKIMEINKGLKVKIVGTGKVGAGIVESFAQNGFEVYGIDINKDNIEIAMNNITLDLDNLIAKGKINEGEKDVVLSRIRLGTDLGLILDADVVIEAVYEDMGAKKELFKAIDDMVVSEEALLLTNTSSLSVTEIASATGRPEHVAGMHFFSPVPVMKLVEVVRGVLTSEQTISKVKQLAILMGKTPIVSADSPGFIVNRLLNALVVEATRIVEEGVGAIEDVDIGARLGCGHPMGPFELIDYLKALPLVLDVTDYMADGLGERFRMPVWVRNLARAGKRGSVAGGKFYDQNLPS